MKTGLPLSLLAQARIYQWSWETHSPWAWFWLVGIIFLFLLFWGIFFLGLVVAVRWMLGRKRLQPSDTAMEILRQRYARSEINKEEFEAKKKDLA